jgi:hypothetical protein
MPFLPIKQIEDYANRLAAFLFTIIEQLSLASWPIYGNSLGNQVSSSDSLRTADAKDSFLLAWTYNWYEKEA